MKKLILILFLAIQFTVVYSQTRLTGGYVDGRFTFNIKFANKITDISKLSALVIKDNAGNIVSVSSSKISSDSTFLEITTKNEIDIKKEYTAELDNNKFRLVFNNIFLDKKYYNLNTELGAIYSKDKTVFRLFAPRAEEITLNIYSNPVKKEGEEALRFKMKEAKGGVWEVEVKKNLEGKYYTFNIKSNAALTNPNLEVIDPYAKIITRGDALSTIPRSYNMPYTQTMARAMVVDLKKTGTVSNLISQYNKIEDAIIWEVHTRDLSVGKNSGIPDEIKGSYKGAAYSGSKYNGVTTGLDHIKELGVTVVQLLPIAEGIVGNETEYKNKYIEYGKQGEWPNKRYYDWGYAPIHYFSPDGWYSSNRDDYSRISEFKNLVSTYHKNNLKVVMDVVLNHTFEGSKNDPRHYAFMSIDADYYYRSSPEDRFYDGVFCQNEIKSENPMVRKLILDCLKYWVKEYKIDGFRFDWMSETDTETLNEVILQLRKINPNILVYGELWNFRNSTFTGKGFAQHLDRQHVGQFEKAYSLPAGSIAGFNDYFRDAIKGSGFQRDYSGGYIQNDTINKYYPSNDNGHSPAELVKKIIKGMVGFTPKSNDPLEWQDINSPLNTINYIECHDGYTMMDKINISEYCGLKEHAMPQSSTNPKVVDFTAEKQKDIIKMHMLGGGILLTSQGIPFIHAGQELLRQKINYNNGIYSYVSDSNTDCDDVNAIKWEDKINHKNVYDFYKGLIQLRKEHPTFRRSTKESVLTGLQIRDDLVPNNAKNCIAYTLSDVNNKIKTEKWKNVLILMNPYKEAKTFTIPEGKWNVVVKDDKAGTQTLEIISNGKATLNGITMMVMYK